MSSTEPGPTAAPKSRRTWFHRLSGLVRWLHIYSSMLGLAATLFFSVTGLTLNHPDWFPSAERSREESGRIDPAWLSPAADPRKLEIVEYLRETHHIQARLKDFSADEYQCVVTFAGPAYTADAFIDTSTGDYDFREVTFGIVPIINDLHKGRDTGPVWSWVIDLSAILLTFVSLTGLLLILWLKRKLLSSFLTALAGTIALALIAWLMT